MPTHPSRVRPFRVVACAPLFGLAIGLAAAACGDDDSTPSGAGGAAQPPPADSEAVVYVGGPTDETYRNVAGLPPIVDARAASLSAPAAGQAVRADTPPTFTWQAAQALVRPARPSLWARAWEALVERTAYAHGMPYTGVAYLLSVRSASGTPLVTALTAETSFTPDPAAWSAVASAGGDLTVTLVTSRFEQNAVVGGGPWATPSGPLPISIAPLARFALADRAKRGRCPRAARVTAKIASDRRSILCPPPGAPLATSR